MDIQAQKRQKLAKLLKSKREQLELSQREMARQMGFRQGTLSQWELSKADPDLTSLAKIAKFFGYTMEEFWAYLEGKDTDRTSTWDVNKMLSILDTMPRSEVATIVNAGVQKLARAS
jgi:transcriptional regulator with XRE-family HTH domain